MGESGKGLTELYMRCDDGNGEMSFTGNTAFHDDDGIKTCSGGFSSIRGRTEDSRGIVDISMLCSGEAEPSNLSGGGWGDRKSCPAGQTINGLRVRYDNQKGIRNFRYRCN